MKTRNKTGFKSYDDNPSENLSAPLEQISVVPQGEKTVPISPAQADLLETIQNLSEIIVDKDFSQFNEAQKVVTIKSLINAVALNIELTTKTNLLII